MALPELLANSPTPGTLTAIGTLTAAMTDTTGLSMSVSASAPAGLQASTGQFRVVVDSEIMLIAASSTGASPWTILQRGVENSTATTHLAAAPVYHYLTAGALAASMSSGGPLAVVVSAPDTGALAGSRLKVNHEAPLNVEWPEYGADPSHTDDTARIQSAINALPQSGGVAGYGGAIYFPRSYKIASQLVLDNLIGVELMGTSRQTSVITSGVTGTGPAISALSANDLTIRNLGFLCAAGLTGNYLNFDWSSLNRDVAYAKILDCQFGTNLGGTAPSLRSWVRFNNTICSSVERSGFVYGTYGIVNGDGAYGIGNTVEKCIFDYQTTAAIATPAGETEAARYIGNTFEPILVTSTTGKANGIYQAGGATSNWGTQIEGNWFGDVNVAGGTYLQLANSYGGCVMNNRFASLPSADTHIKLNGSTSIAIIGNRMENGAIGIDSSPSAPGYMTGVAIMGNNFNGCTTAINPANIAQGVQMGNFDSNSNLDYMTIYSTGYGPSSFTHLGKFNVGGARQVFGSKGGNTALASLVSQLVAIGLITDGTT